jgi:hypothetical protein
MNSLSLKLMEQLDCWTPSLERKFQFLAVREAEESITDEELRELENLARYRQVLRTPQSFREIARQYAQEKALKELLQSLSRYVTLFKSTH